MLKFQIDLYAAYSLLWEMTSLIRGWPVNTIWQQP